MALLRCILLALFFSAGMAPAQEAETGTAGDAVTVNSAPASAAAETTGPDYTLWSSTEARAEAAITAGRASTVALEELRSQLSAWRAEFQDAAKVNDQRLKTLTTQIGALGPAPGEGETEAADIAQRRAELLSLIEQVRAPRLRAEEAFSSADGLIREIDRVIRDRQADELLSLGPSPLNPVNWAPAIVAISGSLHTLSKEVTDAWGEPAQRAEFRSNIPAIVFYVVLGGLLILRSWRWVDQATAQVVRTSRPGRVTRSVLLSLGNFALPLLGTFLLIRAIYALDVVGLRTDAMLSGLMLVVSTFLAGHWVGRLIFPRDEGLIPILDLRPEARLEGRWNFSALGLIVALNILVNMFETVFAFEPAETAVLRFPLLAGAAYLLFRLSALFILHTRHVDADPEEEEARLVDRVIKLAARIAQIIAVLGVVLGVIGYGRAAEGLIVASAFTMGLFAAILILHRLVYDLYAMAIGDPDRARDGLVPVFVNFVLTLMTLPLLALIWGAREADLTELWAQFRTGFQIGNAQISPTDFITFLGVFAVGYAATRLLQSSLKTSVLPKTSIDAGGQNAIVAGTGYLGIFLAALIAISTAGIDLSSLAIVAGALSVGIGFGLQNIVSNFVSGIILLIERPVAEGDWIEVGSTMGIVKDISVRSTRIETFDRTDVIVPNADLVSGTVTNWTRHNNVGRVIVPVGVAYGTDTRKVEQVLLEIAEAHPLVLLSPKPGVVFQGFGADSMDFEIRAILRDVNFVLSVKSDMNHEIARRFVEEGIEIPYAQRDIWIRNPEALQPQQDQD